MPRPLDEWLCQRSRGRPRPRPRRTADGV